jgi:hypothetical protein
MSNRFTSLLAAIARPLVENRLVLSCGLSVAAGIALQSLWPVNPANPLIHLIALERPAAFRFLVWSYTLFLYTTPFLAVSVLLSFIYVHFYSRVYMSISSAERFTLIVNEYSVTLRCRGSSF